jgi:CrcB protein
MRMRLKHKRKSLGCGTYSDGKDRLDWLGRLDWDTCPILAIGWLDQRFGVTFPVGTLVVNLVGCFVAGFLLHALSEKYLIDPVVRSALLIGLLGGFTTFSSFGVQTFRLLRDGELFWAGLNVAITNILGLAFVWAGYMASKFF